MELLLIKQPYAISFAGNPVAFTFLVTPYRLMEQQQDIKIICRVEVEEDMNSTNFVEAKEFFLYPSADGSATASIESLLKPYLKQFIPSLNQTIIGEVVGQVTRYRIAYRLLKDNNLVTDSVHTEGPFFVMKGGMSYQDWHPKKYFTELLPTQKPFLRFPAEKEFVFADEKKFLSWLYPLTDNVDQTLYVKIGYSDGSESTHTLMNLESTYQWKLCITPAGYNQLNLSALAVFGKTPVWYEFSVSSEPMPAAVCIPVTITPIELETANLGEPYSQVIELNGDAPFTLDNIVKPSWMTIAVSGTHVNITGTPDGVGPVDVSFDIINCGAVNASFSQSVDIIIPDTHFEASTFVGGDADYGEETANILGTPLSDVTLKVTTLMNINGGDGLKIDDVIKALNDEFTITLDSSGIGHFNVKIVGDSSNTGTAILAIITIISVSDGAIASTQYTQQYSKAF